MFTNFYTVEGKQRRFHEVALHLEQLCRLMTFSYRFPGIFHSVSPLYSCTINPTASVCRTARHRSSYVHNHRVRSVVRYSGDRRTMQKQRIVLPYDNVVAIKFPGQMRVTVSHSATVAKWSVNVRLKSCHGVVLMAIF